MLARLGPPIVQPVAPGRDLGVVLPGRDGGTDTDGNSEPRGTVGGSPQGEETRQSKSGVDPGRLSSVSRDFNGRGIFVLFVAHALSCSGAAESSFGKKADIA